MAGTSNGMQHIISGINMQIRRKKNQSTNAVFQYMTFNQSHNFRNVCLGFKKS